MLVRIKPSTAMYFTGLYEKPSGLVIQGQFPDEARPNAEEKLEKILAEALVSRKKDGVTDGRQLHTIFRNFQADNNLEGSTWDELGVADQDAWRMLANTISGE